MKKNRTRFKNLKNGFFVFLPFVLFVLILTWIAKLLIGSVSWIIQYLPKEFVDKWTPAAVDIVSILLLVFVVWLVGVIVNHYYLGTKLKNWFIPVIKKIPLLNTLFQISTQVKTTLETSNSFKRVVLIEYPSPGIYSLGFVTNEQLEIFEKVLDKTGLIAVFIPTAPNPANGNSVLVQSDKIHEVDIPVTAAIGYIVSMGTALATEKVIKETQESTVSQGDSFFYFRIYNFFCDFKYGLPFYNARLQQGREMSEGQRDFLPFMPNNPLVTSGHSPYQGRNLSIVFAPG